MSSPEFAEVISAALDAQHAAVHVSRPAVVDSYDAATQTCTCTPVITTPLLDEDGITVYEALPAVQNVPVLFPGGSGFSMHWLLTKGDTVELLFQDYSPAQWRERGVVSDPPDVRAHGPGYPVAVPWYRPGGAAGPDQDRSIGAPGGLRVHFDPGFVRVGSGADFVSLAAKVDAGFAALQSALNAHTHVTTCPAGSGSTATGLPAAASVPPTAASTLKAT